MTTINNNILWNSKGYCTIVCKASVPPSLGSWGYNGVPAAIYVPDEFVDAYKNASVWSTYASLINGLSKYDGKY